MDKDLIKTKEQLIRELDSLRKKSREKEDKLMAFNQQLVASEQQLKAANQQLIASEQQLKAANQQLEATNQQLSVSEKEVKLQRELLLEAQKIAHLGNWTFSPKTGVAWWSEELYRIYSRNPSDGPLVYEEHPELIHPEDWEWFDATVKETVETGKPYDIVLRILRPDGGIRYINSICKPVLDASGAVIEMRGTVQDITDRKEIEFKLIEKTNLATLSEQRLKTFMNNSPVGFGIWDSSFRFVYLNDVLQKINGPTKEEHIGNTVREVLPHGADLIEPLFKEIINEGKSFNNIELSGEVPSHPGVTRHYVVSYFPLFDENNRVERIGGIILDVTEIKNREVAIKKNEEMYRFLTENTSDVIRLQDDTGKFTYISPNIFELTGYTNKEYVKFEPFENVYPKDHEMLREVVNKFINGATAQSVEYRVYHKKGHIIWLESRIKAIRDEHGKIISLVSSTNIISDKKELQLKLEQSERRLKEAQQIAAIGNYEYNIETGEQWWSEELYRILEFDVNKPSPSIAEFSKRLDEEDIVNLQRFMQNVISTGKSDSLIYKIHLPSSDTYKYISSKAEFYVDEVTNAKFIKGTLQDVTERIEVEQKLKQSEEKFRELYNQSPVAIQYYDAKGNLLDVNKKTLELYGIKNYDEIADYNFFDSDKLSENNIQDLKEGKSIFIPDVFDFEAINKHGYFKTDKTGVFYVELLVAPVLNEGEIITYLVHMLDVTEQKLANDKVSISEKKFRNLVENLQELVYRYEFYPSPHFSYVSPNSTDLIGYTPQEHYDNPNLGKEIIHPDDMAIFEKYMAEELNTKKSLICRWTAKNGNIVWTEQKTTPIYDAENKIVAIEGISRNITTKVLAEKELKASEEKFRGVFEDSNVGIAIGTSQGDVIDVNDEYLKITGYSRQEYLKIHFTEISHPDDLKKEQPLFEQLLSGEVDRYRIEKRLKAKGGNYIWLDCAITARKDTNGNIDQILVFVVDITEQKQAEDNFKNSIVESPLGIRIIEQKGKTVYVNKALLDIYEFSSFNEYISAHALERYTEQSYQEHQERKKIMQIGGDISDYEISIRRKNGEIRHLKVWRKEVIWNGEKHFQVINQDITDLKQLNTDLILAKEKAEESDRLKSAFLSNMSHEIRTPMNGILGFTGLLKEPHLTGVKRDKYIHIIEKSGNRMLKTINDIVDISKIEAGQVEVSKKEVSVNRLLQEQFNFFVREAEAKELELIYKPIVSDSDSLIISDEQKLDSILTNLIKNAIKYTEAGSITFGYNIKTENGNNTCEFYVKDTGIGIPVNRLDAIFNRFEQADIEDTRVFEGSGLGLTISKSYVEMLGGTIAVSSEVGKGSTFTFNIPYIQQNKKVDTSSFQNGKEGPVVSLNKLSIIVAEDDEVSKMLLETILENKCSNIIYTSTGKETVDKCRENPDTDIILMDIKMPDLNGFEATKLIRKFNKDIIIIAHTAYALTGDKEKALEVGCNNYIAKPINKERLLETIQVCLHKKVM